MMAFAGIREEHREFVFRLLGSGLQLGELVADLAESLPREHYPGEDPTSVVLEMLCGSIATALDTFDVAAVIHATELIEVAHDRAIEHLRLAVALGKRREGGSGAPNQG